MSERSDPFSEKSRIERLEAQVLKLSPGLAELEYHFGELKASHAMQSEQLDELLRNFSELVQLLAAETKRENDAEEAAFPSTLAGMRKEIDDLREFIGGPTVFAESTLSNRMENVERYLYDHTHDNE